MSSFYILYIYIYISLWISENIYFWSTVQRWSSNREQRMTHFFFYGLRTEITMCQRWEKSNADFLYRVEICAVQRCVCNKCLVTVLHASKGLAPLVWGRVTDGCVPTHTHTHKHADIGISIYIYKHSADLRIHVYTHSHALHPVTKANARIGLKRAELGQEQG